MEHMEQSAEQQREQFRKKCLTEAGLTYSVAAVLPVLLSLLVIGVVSAFAGEAFQSTQAYLYLCFILPQLCFARRIAPIRFAVAHGAEFAVSLLFGTIRIPAFARAHSRPFGLEAASRNDRHRGASRYIRGNGFFL